MQPLITVYCPFTRPWAVDQWLRDLASCHLDPARTNLAFTIDMDDQETMGKLKMFAVQGGYRSFNCIMNEDHTPNENNLVIRRARIAQVKNQSKNLIGKTDCEFVLSLEDDTRFPDLDIRDWVKMMRRDHTVGFIEGTACGRWGVKMVGAWWADDHKFPTEIETMLPPSEALLGGHYYARITGGGWYGYLTRKELYLDCDYYTATSQPWGPDVNYGIWLASKGYDSFIDWAVKFGHDDYGVTLYPDKHIESVRYTKNKSTGFWDRTDIKPSNN